MVNVEDPKEVEKLILERSEGYGGVCALITGGTGYGKTNALARCGLYRLKKHKEVVIWRGKNTCQWNLFIDHPADMVLWLREGLTYKVINRNKREEINPNKYFHSIERWNNEEDLIERIYDHRDKLNIIQTVPSSPTNLGQQLMFAKSWLKIMEEMVNRTWPDWITFCFDEFEDMAPQNKGGMFEINMGTAMLQKEMRKNKINSYYSTHKVTEVDWHVRNKIPYKVFMGGTKVTKDSRIYQQVIMKLNPGEAITESNRFEKFKFKLVGIDKNLRARIKVDHDMIKHFSEIQRAKKIKTLKEKIRDVQLGEI